MTFGKASALNWNIVFENNVDYTFRNMTENRKRSREDDTCEFMPLSKRINNLHLNNNLSTSNVAQNHNTSQANGLNLDSGISSPSSTDSDRRPSYDPGVSSSQSSYYFENKLLFELHLERIQRSGQQYPF